MAVRLPGPEDITQVGSARDPGVQASGEDFGAQIGRAMQQAGQTIRNVGQLGVRLAQERQEAEDKVFLDTLDLEHAKRTNETFLNAQAEAPLGGEGFTETVDQSLIEIEESLPDQVAQERGFRPSQNAIRAAQAMATNRRANVLVKAQTWEHNRRVEALGSQFDETVDTLAQTAFSTGDPEESLARLYDSAKAYEGIIPAAALEEKIQGAEETIVQKTIEGLILADRNDEAEALTQKYFGGRPPENREPIPKDTQGRGSRVMSRLMGHGLTKAQAAGIVGNLVQESNVRSDGPTGDAGTAHGMAQWRGERFNRLKRFAAARNKEWTDFDTQVDFIVTELQTHEVDAWRRLKSASTVEEATAAFMSYERPAGWSAGNPTGGHGWDNRLNAALSMAGEEVSADPPAFPNASEALRLYSAIDTNRKSSASLFKADLERTVGDAVAATTQTGGYDGTLPDEDAFFAAYGEDGPRRYHEFQKAMGTGRTMYDMRTMSTEEIIQAVRESKPGEAGPGFAAQRERHETVVGAAERIFKAREENPASYVVSTFPSVARMWKNAQSGEDMQRAGRASLDIQEGLGLPRENRRVLSNSQVSGIVGEFLDQPEGGQSAAQFMQGLQDQWGDLWPQVFSEISAELPATTMIVGSMNRPSQARAAEELSEAIKVGREGYEKLLPQIDRNDIRDGVLDRIPEFAETALPIVGGEYTTNAVRESMELLALRYVSRGDAPSRAVERAWEDVIGKAYNFQDGYRVPIDHDQDAVWWGGRETLANIGEIENIDLPVSVQGVDEEGRREAYLSALRQQGRWVTAPDESGLVLYDGVSAAVTVNGEPLKYTWDDLMAQGQPENVGMPGVDEMRVSP